MYKQGHHWHSWKRRWFVLRLSSLEYHRRRRKSVDDKTPPQGKIPLDKITALQRDVGKFPQPFCFQLVIANFPFLLSNRASSETHRQKSCQPYHKFNMNN